MAKVAEQVRDARCVDGGSGFEGSPSSLKGQSGEAEVSRLYDEFAPTLQRRVARIVGSSEAAEDVVHEVFAMTLTKLEQGKKIDNLGAWLNTCAHRAALCVLRDRKRRPQVSLVESDGTGEVKGQLGHRYHDEPEDRSAKVIKALSNMPERQCMAFLLAEIKGLDYNEAAVELGTTPGAMRQLLFRARVDLREKLGSQLAVTAAPALRQHFSVTRPKSGLFAHLYSSVADKLLNLAAKMQVEWHVNLEKAAAAAAAPVAVLVLIGGGTALVVSGAFAVGGVPEVVKKAKDKVVGSSPPPPHSSQGGSPSGGVAPGSDSGGGVAPALPVGDGGGKGAAEAAAGPVGDFISPDELTATTGATSASATTFGTWLELNLCVVDCPIEPTTGTDGETRLSELVDRVRERRAERLERRQDRREQFVGGNPAGQQRNVVAPARRGRNNRNNGGGERRQGGPRNEAQPADPSPGNGTGDDSATSPGSGGSSGGSGDSGGSSGDSGGGSGDSGGGDSGGSGDGGSGGSSGSSGGSGSSG